MTSRLVAVRDKLSYSDASLKYFTSSRDSNSCVVLDIIESSRKVDGIGGVVWEGALVMCEFLQRSLKVSESLVIDIGCGTGICGLTVASIGGLAVLSDREIDLAEENYQILSRDGKLRSDSIELVEYEWGNGRFPLKFHEKYSTKQRVIVGVEVACLLKQQEQLVKTLEEICDSNSIILISFDAGEGSGSKYESEFFLKMTNRRFLHKEVAVGKVVLQDDLEPSEKHDLTQIGMLVSMPPLPPDCKRQYVMYSSGNSDGRCLEQHKLVAFYKQSSVRICSRCQNEYFEALNHSATCRHHGGYFVCRKHPGETKCSIDGLGDDLGYYGNGIENWQAKFWDCCGSEDEHGVGCLISRHVPYH